MNLNLENIAEAIWAAMENGANALRNSATRAYVDDTLRGVPILSNPQDFDERALMKQFFLARVRDFPGHETLQYVEPHLDALREMRMAMNVEQINEQVALFQDCRIAEPRQNLDEFKQELRELVLHEWE